MLDARPRLYFDFVDPGSLLLHHRLAALGAAPEIVGFELRPPPEPLVDADDPAWVAWWNGVVEPLHSFGYDARRPTVVPWTRKAHEAMLHAADVTPSPDALVARLRDRIVRAYLEEGADIGRIDVLVPLCVAEGLDRTDIRTALDVDRWREAVEAARRDATAAGVRGVPTVLHRGRRLEGVHDEDTLRTFLVID